MSTVNLYDVLNIPQECTTKEIKEAYRGLAKQFHPDKPTGDAEMFELVTHAYNILVNHKSRKDYDEIYALSKQVETSHFDLKLKSRDYFTAIDNDVTKKKKPKEEYEHEFKKVFEDMDRKHGYKRDKSVVEPLSEKKTTKRLRDFELARQQDDIENIHDEIFEGGRFDLERFNAAFDAMHKVHTELIPHSGNPMAYNLGEGIQDNFGSVDNYEDLYGEDDLVGNSIYGTVKLDTGIKKKLTKEDVGKISSAEYTKGHNYKDKTYAKTLDEKLRERNQETTKYDDREINDFDASDNCGGYGIFNQLGIKNLNAISWDDSEDIKTRYNRMLEMRKTGVEK